MSSENKLEEHDPGWQRIAIRDQSFKLGIAFPQTEIGTDAHLIGQFAKTVEAAGFAGLLAYDHVIGANPASRPDWKLPYTHASSFHEPITLFSFLAAQTQTLQFTTAVVIMPQRQTVLFAKQAANLDIFCEGRLRLGLGVGYTELEYEALGVPFSARGARLDEQIEVLRGLWTTPSYTMVSRFHTIHDAGISPLPYQRPIPIWIGGNTLPSLRRAARLGNGWLPYLSTDTEGNPAGLSLSSAKAQLAQFRELVVAAGRRADDVPVEVLIFLHTLPGGAKRYEALRRCVSVLREAGASGVFIDTMRIGVCHPAEHLDEVHRLADALLI